jgi:hypothetical protein
MHLAWEYASNPADHGRFSHMLRVSPHVFQTILSLIQHHPVFTSHSNVPQAPVEVQLAVTLYRMGRYGNSASIQDIAWTAGCLEGSVENYTDRCFDAIESLQEIFVRRLTPEEKEREKQWIDQKLGFKGAWRDGWLMYDGTIVVLYRRPGLNGDAYYTRKANYGLNVQVWSTTWFSNFCIHIQLTRLEMLPQPFVSLIFHMVTQGHVMMHVHSRVQLPTDFLTGYLRGMNSHGLTRHTPVLHE